MTSGCCSQHGYLHCSILDSQTFSLMFTLAYLSHSLFCVTLFIIWSLIHLYNVFQKTLCNDRLCEKLCKAKLCDWLNLPKTRKFQKPATARPRGCQIWEVLQYYIYKCQWYLEAEKEFIDSKLTEWVNMPHIWRKTHYQKT